MAVRCKKLLVARLKLGNVAPRKRKKYGWIVSMYESLYVEGATEQEALKVARARLKREANEVGLNAERFDEDESSETTLHDGGSSDR